MTEKNKMISIIMYILEILTGMCPLPFNSQDLISNSPL